MISQKTITVNNIQYIVNVCDSQSNWVLIHDDSKVISLTENINKSGIIETVLNIFEGSSKEECLREIKRLNLEYNNSEKEEPKQQKQAPINLFDLFKLSA